MAAEAMVVWLAEPPPRWSRKYVVSVIPSVSATT